MKLTLYQVDAFADRVFSGNPAAIVPLAEWLPDATLQAIAAENNLSQTAFLIREGTDYAIRWFTPLVEDELCGHATLAAAYVVTRVIEPGRAGVAFRTRRAGTLAVRCAGNELVMDFPAWPSAPAEIPRGLAAALGGAPAAFLRGRRDGLAIFASAAELAALRPDFAALKRDVPYAVICTAPGEGEVDFVSRFFAPDVGIDEDPVTGSTHCALIPYWAGRLGKTRLEARQISRRGGALRCALAGDRVAIAGRAALYLEGTIAV